MATTDFNQMLKQLTTEIQSFHQEVKTNGGKTDKKRFEALAKLIKTDSDLMKKENRLGKDVSVSKETANGIAQAAQLLMNDPSTKEQAGLLKVNFFITELQDFQELIMRMLKPDFYHIDPKSDAEM